LIEVDDTIVNPHFEEKFENLYLVFA